MGIAVLKVDVYDGAVRRNSMERIRSLSTAKGIRSVDVDYSTYTVSIEYDEDKIGIGEIRSILNWR
jgi:hypothetical protein